MSGKMSALNRLKEAIFKLKKSRDGLTNQIISNELGYKTPAYLSDILGGSKPINDFFLNKLVVEYSINKEWILEGKGEMFIKNAKNDTKDPGASYSKDNKTTASNSPGIPVFDVPVKFGIDGNIPTSYIGMPQFKDCDFAILASGDSMSPKVRNGDYIVCKATSVDEIIMGEAYLILTHKGTEVIKYVYPHETKDDHILLVSHDQTVPPTELPRSAIHKIYKVKGVVKTY
ncbi:S24 family peptidase [Chitinophaga cymbidii]|uniref:Peptidase S24/S26A/S26B/S26C domain-containing protein n=1 Tax=Chitinophaga cymbidii TaxID=1096750 RepID=A0A512RFK4_9BACT|nr:S24 family peptidase [Chitinophaga cymbidii]GEP94428.1 hypothetical protein CCY01nite_06880 [Chitinophaga cymbidii]